MTEDAWVVPGDGGPLRDCGELPTAEVERVLARVGEVAAGRPLDGGDTDERNEEKHSHA